MSSINVPALVGGFTGLGFLAIGVCFIPRLLEARARYQQQRRNGFTAQTHSNRRPSIPSRHNVPPLRLQDIELTPVPRIHIIRPQVGSAHQNDGTKIADQGTQEEAAWEIGKAV